MRIVFTGAGGTGKSVTAKLVAAALELPYLPSVARSVFARHGVTEADQLNMTDEQRWELQEEIIHARIAAEDSLPSFISDRCLLDHLAYSLYRCNRVMSESCVKLLERQVRSRLGSADLIVYAPHGLFTPESDGFREDGYGYNSLIDAIIFGKLTCWGIHPLWLGPGSVEDRANQVVKAARRKARLKAAFSRV